MRCFASARQDKKGVPCFWKTQYVSQIWFWFGLSLVVNKALTLEERQNRSCSHSYCKVIFSPFICYDASVWTPFFGFHELANAIKRVSMNHFNSLRPRQNGRHFADDIFKCIFLNENVWIPIEMSLKVVSKSQINNIPALVQIMAWRRSSDKPFSEPINVSLLTHICVIRPQWINTLVLSWYVENHLKAVKELHASLMSKRSGKLNWLSHKPCCARLILTMTVLW